MSSHFRDVAPACPDARVTRRILFQLHWFLGITAGLVLALMGVTGAIMGFDEEIVAALSRDRMTVEPTTAPRLTPDALRAQVREQAPGANIDRLTLRSDPAEAASVRLTPQQGQGGQRRQVYIDPYTGQFLGEARGTGFFAFVRQLHRWLALPGGGNGIGRTITGFCVLTLIFFVVSGIYLRWPAQPLDWRVWLALDWRKTGRNLYRNLHVIVGTWVTLVYLVIALTGLWWSYGWYRAGATRLLTGEWPAPRASHEAPPREQREREGARPETARGEGPRGEGPRADARPNDGQRVPRGEASAAQGARGEGRGAAVDASWDAAWAAFVGRVGPDYGDATLSTANGALRIEHLPEGARFGRMTDQYQLDLASGEVRSVERYADRDLGKTIVTNVLPIHNGRFFGVPGQIVMMLSSAAMPLFAITGILLYLHRRRRKVGVPRDAAVSGGFVDDSVLVAYASQTGGALRLAHVTAQAFTSGGQAVSVLPLARVDAAVLSQARRALFIVSTYGDGEPPDTARRFERQSMQNQPATPHLQYGVLALGDREYPQFCAFGHRVDRWLQSGGAQTLFKTIEVDGDEAAALAQWHARLSDLGAGQAAAMEPEPYRRWRLVQRRCLNQGGVGLLTFHLAFEPLDGVLDWQAGDIAELLPLPLVNLDAASIPAAPHEIVDVLPTPALPAREYSIASLPADGRLELIVRQVRRDDGELGIGSGWITSGLALGGEIEMRVRANPGFRLPPSARPLVLIGNGTGLAGLRAHLRAHAAAGHGGHWLLFGERNRAHDAYFDDELQQWSRNGVLTRLDRAYSRDADCGRYVQDLLRTQADEIRRNADQGAAFLVCGSLAGMAGSVDAQLRAALGDERVDQLAERGLYLRDVY